MTTKTLEEAKNIIACSSPESSVYVGCDSIRFKKIEADGRTQFYARYTTVVILHMDSKHGCQLFQKTMTLPDFGNIKQRLLTEAGLAVEAAYELLDYIGDRYLEVHLDLNKSPKHKSYVAVQEALGYVRGNLPGVEVRIKPDAFAASHGADHAVRGKKC